MQSTPNSFDYQRYYNENKHYSDFEQVKDKTLQRLWNVDHDDFAGADHKFGKNRQSPIYEAYAEGHGGPFGQAPIPKGMLRFIESLLKFLGGAHQSDYTQISDVAHYTLQSMDFCDAYAPFTHMPLTLTGNQLVYTYKLKKGGSVLNPSEIEVFKLDPNWEFNEYKKAIGVIKHPLSLAAFRGENPKTAEGKDVTRDTVLDYVSEIIWDGPECLNSWVHEWMDNYYESDLPTLFSEMGQGLGISRERFFEQDFVYWKTVVIGAMLWMRSPNSLPFLIEYHPVYSAVLRFNQETNLPEIIPQSGGEAIVHAWDVFTHQHLDVLKNSPPGTCDNCRVALHCTKLVNATAIAFPKCSCGQFVDPQATEFWSHDGASSLQCGEYRSAHPIVSAFGCRRCLGVLIEKRADSMPCAESTVCPNTACPHHAGASYYMKTLNERRKLLLTHRH